MSQSGIDVKINSGLSAYCLRNIVSVAVLMLIMPVYAVSAQAAATAGINFEIPINELNKDKKEAPPNQVTVKPQKKKKSVNRSKAKKKSQEKQEANDSDLKKINELISQDSVPAAVAPAQLADHQKTSGKEVKDSSPVKTETRSVPVVPEPIPKNSQIDHYPYSFVVAGKSTVINAVIYRETDLQAVNCKVRTAETGAESLVKMTKVNGSRFTYTATLPGLAAGSSSLRYTIVITDSAGKETISPEFVTPVTASPVVPSWQF